MAVKIHAAAWSKYTQFNLLHQLTSKFTAGAKMARFPLKTSPELG